MTIIACPPHFNLLNFSLIDIQYLALSSLTVHLSALRSRVSLWKRALPDIRPYYAVKCNQLSPILEELQKQGCGFDCASSDEIKRVKAVGASPSDIIFANPCKSRSDIRFAKNQNVKYATFDTVDELKKLYQEHPEVKPVLRIHVDDKGTARIPLNKKFGFHYTDLYDLVRNKAPIFGIAFHVGSDCKSTLGYLSAIETVEKFTKSLKPHSFFKPEILDIGGGFSGESKFDYFFENEIARVIRDASVRKEYGRTIAEPGRFMATSSCSLKVPVIGRKSMPDGTIALTIDESIYGMLSGVAFDGFKPFIQSDKVGMSSKFTIFGRTCDSADIIAKDVLLPYNTVEGDILTIKNIGAYSYASASEFNGFPKPVIISQGLENCV